MYSIDGAYLSKAYHVGFYIIQFILALISLRSKNNRTLDFLGGIMTAGVIYLLCILNFKLIANVMLGLLIVRAVLD